MCAEFGMGWAMMSYLPTLKRLRSTVGMPMRPPGVVLLWRRRFSGGPSGLPRTARRSPIRSAAGRCRGAGAPRQCSALRSCPWSMPPSGRVARVSLVSLSGVEIRLEARHLLAQGLDLGAHRFGLAHDFLARPLRARERVFARDLGHDLPVALRRGVPLLDELLLLLAPGLALVHEHPFRARLKAGVGEWALGNCEVRPVGYHITGRLP